jgi:hypothetical protein
MTKQSRKRTATKRKARAVRDRIEKAKHAYAVRWACLFKTNFGWPFDNVNAIILKDR